MANQNTGNQQNQGNQQGSQQGNSSQAGREINPNRPSGEPGKLPQNAGSALDANKGGTTTQQGQQSKSQSAQSMKGEPRDERNNPAQAQAKPGDQRNANAQDKNDPRNKTQGGTSRNTQDEEKPTGIGQAVKKGQDIDAAGDVGADEDSAGGQFPGREKGAM